MAVVQRPQTRDLLAVEVQLRRVLDTQHHLTINGRSYSWTIDQSNADVRLDRPMEWFGRQAHSACVNGWGTASDGMKIWASSQVVSSKTPFLSSVDIARNIVFDTGLPGVNSNSYCEASRETDVVHAGGVHETEGFRFRSVEPLSSATWTVSAVPEPGQDAMLLAGVGILAYVRRRSARFQQAARETLARTSYARGLSYNFGIITCGNEACRFP